MARRQRPKWREREMKGAIILVVCLALISFGPKYSFAAEAGPPEKQTIVIQLQQAVRANDKAWLAAHTNTRSVILDVGKASSATRPPSSGISLCCSAQSCARRYWRRIRRTCSRIGKG